MKYLKLFLDTFAGTFSEKVVFVPKKTMQKTLFNAFKEITLEVYEIKGKNKTVVSRIVTNAKLVTDKDKEDLDRDLYTKTLENIFEYYFRIIVVVEILF